MNLKEIRDLLVNSEEKFGLQFADDLNLLIDFIVASKIKIEKIDVSDRSGISDNSDNIAKFIYHMCVANEVPIVFNNTEYSASINCDFFCEPIEIKSKDQLLTLLSNNGEFYYRGESKLFDKPISSSLSRAGWTQEIYHNQLSKYVKYGKLFKEDGLISHDNLALWNREVHAQHHGLPTPFIDITRKKGIALFFATDSDFSEDFVIYAISNSVAATLTGNADLSDIDMSDGQFYFYEPEFIDRRFESQQGLFIRPYPQDLNLMTSVPVISSWLSGRPAIKIYKISGALKEDIKTMLSQMNIDRFTMYLDYDNLAKAIKKGEK